MKEIKEVKIRLSKRKVMLTILLVFVIILIVLTSKLIGFITKDREVSNLGNMGLAVQDGKYIYYNKWEEGIFKSKGNKEEMLIDETAYSMNVVDDTIYFLSVSSKQEILLKSIKTNGEDLKTLKRLYTSISKIYVQDGYIYFVTNEGLDGISKYNIETGESNLIVSSNIKDYVVYEDKIYFTDDRENLYVMTNTGIELQRIINAPIIEKFQIQDDNIYFYNLEEEKFCRVDLNGENLEVISDRIEENANYNITSRKIYFYDKQTNSISKMDLDGDNIELVKEINAKKTKINIVDDEIYYLDSSNDPSQAYQIFRVGVDGKKLKEIIY